MADKGDLGERRAKLSAAKREMLEMMLRRRAGAGASRQIVPRPAGQSSAPLSFSQQRLWFLDQLEPGNPFYNITRSFHVAGDLDVGALSRSLGEIVRRHEALRTNFTAADGEPLQVIAPPPAQCLSVRDLSDVPESRREEEARRLIYEQAQGAFDLRQGALFRASLLRLGAGEYVLTLSMHHIISDGWSMGVLFRELGALYEAFSAGAPSPLPELPVQYADYALWQRRWLDGERLESQLGYWRQQLAGARVVLELPYDRRRPAEQNFRGAKRWAKLGRELSEALKRFSTQHDATVFMTLLAGFKFLLWRYSGQADINVGTPVANRNRPEIEGLIGFFVNTLVLRTQVSGEASFRSLLAQVREVCLNAYAHQDVPFERLVEELQPERSLSYTPLFQVIFALQNAGGEPLELKGVELRPYPVDAGTTIFDLTLSVEEQEEGLAVLLQYNSELFEEATAERLLRHYERALEICVAQPERMLGEIPLLDEEELRRLLVEWNDTAREYPRDSSIHESFEAQAAATPDAIALVYEDEQLTYRELDERANQMGRYLQGLGVGPEALVGVLMERSVESVVCLLGILKAGGGYVPLDAQAPRARLALMIEDAGVRVVAAQEGLKEVVEGLGAEVVCVDCRRAEIEGQSRERVESVASAENLAYVIYTSGSTGVPKGVMVTHRNVLRLVKGVGYAELNADETFLQFAPVSFDASTFEIWGALLNGARLALFPSRLASLSELADSFTRHGVTTLWLTAGLFHQMAEHHPEALAGVRQLLAGGDVLSEPHVRRVLQAKADRGGVLINGYGPTESTTFACTHTMSDDRDLGDTVPIGRPIANTQAYILDSALLPAPQGVSGHLYLGGDGLARGYLARPALTAERFIPDPFSREPGSRLYRTGDLARYLPSGEIEFLGRADDQVKIRGFRIELGEIESVLSEHESVGACVVVAQDDPAGQKRLVAYVSAAGSGDSAGGNGAGGAGGLVTGADLKRYLAGRVPEYMVPAAVVVMDELPLTANGKVDRRALPAAEWEQQGGAEREYEAPRTPTEELLAGIWRGVLGVERVGVGDNFFELGGHSLMATQVISQIRKRLGVEVALRRIFEQPTVRGLAEEVERAKAAGEGAATSRPIRRASREGRRLTHPLAEP